MRHLELSPVSTAPSVNVVPTTAPPVAPVPHSLPVLSVSNAHSSQVGVASQTPTTRIWTPISHPNLSAATPYSSSLPPSTIPTTTLSHPVTYEQFLRGELPIPMSQLHKIHAPSPLRTPQPHNPLYDTARVPGLEPKRTLLPPFAPSSHTRLTDFTTNEPYSRPTKMSNFAVSSEKSKDSSRGSSRSTVRTRSSSFDTSRNYDMGSMPSGFPKLLEFVAFTSSSRERPRRFTNHSLHGELFPQHVVASSRGPT